MDRTLFLRHPVSKLAGSAALAALVVLVPATAAPGAARSRGLLRQALAAVDFRAALVGPEAWRPYPKDAAGWRQVPEAQRRAFVAAAERELTTGWATVPATAFLAYSRTGDRASYERLANQRRHKLGLLLAGELLEGRGRFVDAIADGVWVICEESFWGSVAHLGDQGPLPDVRAPIVDLFAAETGALLAWTDYLVGERLDAVNPRVRERLRLEVERRVLAPALERDDFWWMGFGNREVNNWNPWINSNWLTAVLLLERDPDRRLRAVEKIARSLDRFIDGYPDDGGCDEGPVYWGHAAASLFESLDLLASATGGRADVRRASLVRAMARFIASAHIKDEWFVNVGDAAARLRPAPELVYRYGKAAGEPEVAAFGAWLARRRGPYGPDEVQPYGTPGRVLPALSLAGEIAAAPAAEPLEGEVWLPDLQLMAAREKPGSADGLYVAAWGGHNAQSHNHNDVGNVLVFADGRPVLADAGVGEYTSKTFSARRYEIWTMQSQWHNLPAINGVDQAAGAAFLARDVTYRATPVEVRFSLDIAPAWPAAAQVTKWKRDVVLDRAAHRVVIDEDYALAAAREPVRLNFLTPLAADVARPGRVLLTPEAGCSQEILYDAERFRANVEERRFEDSRLNAVWGDRLFRVVLTGKDLQASGRHRLVIRAVD
jgi:hypothetical protein